MPDTATLTFPELDEVQFRLFQQLFRQRLGLNLSDQKRLMLRGRLLKRIRQLGLSGFQAYFDLISQPGHPEWPVALDLVTTHETYFFREPRHFDWLREQVIPSRTPGQILRVWSAACSSGEEPYSVAMVLHEAMGSVGWELLATDVDAPIVQRARRGLFREERLEGIPPALLKRYCLHGTGEHAGEMLIDRNLRALVDFEVINLMNIPEQIGGFDVIFLRNVIIYFDAPTKQRVVHEAARRLNPGGWLFLGHSESLAGMNVPLLPVRPSIYQRLDA